MSGHDESGDWLSFSDFDQENELDSLLKAATTLREPSPTPSSDALPTAERPNDHARRRGSIPRNTSSNNHRKRRRSSPTTSLESWPDHQPMRVVQTTSHVTSVPGLSGSSRDIQSQQFDIDSVVDTDSDGSLPELPAYRSANRPRRSYIPPLARRRDSVDRNFANLDIDNVPPPPAGILPSPPISPTRFLSARSLETLTQSMDAVRQHRNIHAPLTPAVIEVDDGGEDSVAEPQPPQPPTTALPPPTIHLGSTTALEVDPAFLIPVDPTDVLATFMWRRANGGIRKTTVITKQTVMETSTTQYTADLVHSRPRMRKRVRGRKAVDAAPAPVEI